MAIKLQVTALVIIYSWFWEAEAMVLWHWLLKVGSQCKKNGWGNEKWQFSTSNRICNQPHFPFTQPFFPSLSVILSQEHMYRQRSALRPCAQCSCAGLHPKIGSCKHDKEKTLISFPLTSFTHPVKEVKNQSLTNKLKCTDSDLVASIW